MSGESLIALRAVSLGYGAHPVLSGVDLSLAPGELLGVVGPNGAGKTTLLRGLLGLLEPRSGQRVGEPRASYVTQHEQLDSLYPLSVGELVAQGNLHPTRGLTRSRPAPAEAVAAALMRVGLDGRAGTPFAQLSGGQLQRALLARALVAEPALLALDEPTSGVDPEAADRVLDLVQGVAHDSGCAAVLVSHDLQRLVAKVDRVAIVRDGTVRLAGASELGVAQLLDAIAPTRESAS